MYAQLVMSIANDDDVLTTGTEGAKWFLSYTFFVKAFTVPTNEVQVFANWLLTILKGISSKQQDRTKLWSGFHTLRSSKEFYIKWQQYLECIHLRNEPIFYQHLSLNLFEHIWCITFKVDTGPTESNPIEFTYEEENAMVVMLSEGYEWKMRMLNF